MATDSATRTDVTAEGKKNKIMFREHRSNRSQTARGMCVPIKQSMLFETGYQSISERKQTKKNQKQTKKNKQRNQKK